MLDAFGDPDSAGARLAATIADNPLLSKFMFLKSEPARSLGTGRQSLSFPLFPDAECGHVGRAGREDYKEQGRKLDERLGRAVGDLQPSHSALTREALEALPREPGLLMAADDIAGGGMNDGAFLKALAEMIARGGMPAKHMEEITRTSYELGSWEKLREASRRVRTAQKNTASLSDELGRRGGADQVSTALSKMADMAEISTEAACLDCLYEKGLMPLMPSEANAGRASLKASCPRCGGTGLLHTVILGFPDSVRPIMSLDSSWFHEAVVGYAVSQTGRVERASAHKKIAPLGAAGRGEGAEADVPAVTRDGRLYVAEATRQGDTDNAGRNIERRSALRAAGYRLAGPSASRPPATGGTSAPAGPGYCRRGAFRTRPGG